MVARAYPVVRVRRGEYDCLELLAVVIKSAQGAIRAIFRGRFEEALSCLEEVDDALYFVRNIVERNSAGRDN